MVREAYESPRMEFEEVRMNETVADTCWGYHRNESTLYADVNGSAKGYYSFAIRNGNCDLNLINVKYYPAKGEEGSSASADQIAELNKYLLAHQTNNAQNFAGSGNVITENPDDPMIS